MILKILIFFSTMRTMSMKVHTT